MQWRVQQVEQQVLAYNDRGDLKQCMEQGRDD